MANDERRGSGFGPPARPDGRPSNGHPDAEPVEATRALDVADLAPAPTRLSAGTAPRPAPPRPAPPRPAVIPPPVADRTDDDDGEGATQMLNTSDLQARLAAAQAAQQKPGKPIELKISGGPDRGKSHDVLPGESLVGRGLDCQIVLADPAVSRKHFKIVRTGDEAVLIDLGGANGTLVNSQKVQRKVLEPGDRIDVGTSVLEVVIDGHATKVRAAAPAAMRPVTEESGPMHAEAPPPAQPAGGRKWLLPVAIGVVLLIAGGVAAWVLLAPSSSSGSGEQAAPAEGAAEADDAAVLKKLIAEATSLIEEGEYEEAKDLLRKPRKQYPDDEALQTLYKKAKAEVANQEKLDEAKEALTAKDYPTAFEKLAAIPKDSELFDDAEEELTSARSRYADEKLREASAMMATDSAKAVAILDELLKLMPDNAAAKALRAQLDAPGDAAAGAAPAANPMAAPNGAAPAGAAPTGATVAKPADGKLADNKTAPAAVEPAKLDPAKAAAAKPAEPAAAKPAAAAPAAPAAAAAGGARADFSLGLAAYKRRAWTESVQAFQAIADGAYAKVDKVRATRLVSAVKAVESAMSDAKAASGVAAAKAWRRAYDNDKEVDGSQASFLIKTTAQAWVDAARKAKADGKFDDAMEYAQESQNYEELPEAAQIIAACKQKAAELLAQAKDNMKKGNYATAGDQARKVAKILGSADPRSAEATQLAKDAAEKARGED